MYNELDERSAREMVILALFGFFTQVMPFTHRTYAYIEEINNGRQSSVAVAHKKRRITGSNRGKETDVGCTFRCSSL